jgi:hypothetical protein
VHSRVDLAFARLIHFQEGLPGVPSSSEPNNQPAAAAVAAAAAVVREFYVAALAPLDTSGKGPALSFLPEKLAQMLWRPKNADCLKHMRNFSKMFDANGLHADRLLRPPPLSTEQSEAEDELLVELLRAGQALENVRIAAEEGPTTDWPAVMSKPCKDDGAGTDWQHNWLGMLATCLAKEATNTYKRLRSRMTRPSAASCRQQEPQDLQQLTLAVRRLRELANRLAVADPVAAEQARAALGRERSLWAAGSGASGVKHLPTSSVAASGKAGQSVQLDVLCRYVLLGVSGGAGARPLDAEHDEHLGGCLRAVALREAARAEACDSQQDIGALCLVWWASAELAEEVRCCARRARPCAWLRVEWWGRLSAWEMAGYAAGMRG